MKQNSKNKGSKFEREISKKLSLWFSNNTRSDIFWRTLNSGGQFTKNKNKEFLNETSDIKCINNLYDGKLLCSVFSIECKHYKQIDLWNIINKNGDIINWWDKLLIESQISEKYPLLIIKQNNKPIMCLVNEEISNYLCTYFDIYSKLDFIYNNTYISIYLLDEILNLDIETFKEMLRKILGKETYK